MSFRNPRLGPPLALLSSFKLFLIAIAIGGSGCGMPCAWSSLVHHWKAICSMVCS